MLIFFTFQVNQVDSENLSSRPYTLLPALKESFFSDITFIASNGEKVINASLIMFCCYYLFYNIIVDLFNLVFSQLYNVDNQNMACFLSICHLASSSQDSSFLFLCWCPHMGQNSFFSWEFAFRCASCIVTLPVYTCSLSSNILDDTARQLLRVVQLNGKDIGNLGLLCTEFLEATAVKNSK